MNVQSLTIRQPPYYRTLYNNKQHFYLQLKQSNYGRKSCNNYKLGRYHYHNSQCSSGGSQTLIFVIIFIILISFIK